MNTLLFIGYIIAITILVGNAYILIVWGLKFYFHDLTHGITEIAGREKNIIYKINSYCLIVFALLSPVILVAYPLFLDLSLDSFETTKNSLLHVIAFLIYTAALLGGFYHVILLPGTIWKFRKVQKKIK